MVANIASSFKDQSQAADAIMAVTAVSSAQKKMSTMIPLGAVKQQPGGNDNDRYK